MSKLLDRLACALRVLVGRRVIVLDVSYDKHRDQDRVVMWGTIDNVAEQIKLLRAMADSVEADFLAAREKELLDLSNSIN